MNWYKKATQTIRFPDALKQQINKIVEAVVLFFRKNKSVPKENIRVGTISYFSSYYHMNVRSDIYLTNKTIEDTGVGGKRDRISGTIFMNVFGGGFSLDKKIKDKTIREMYKGILDHEATHSSDVKMNRSDLKDKYKFFDNIQNEFLRPTEFDAYSKNIVNIFAAFCEKDKNNKNILIKILGTGDILKAKQVDEYFFPKHIEEVIIFWQKNSPKYYKTLLKRIYNEIINQTDDIKGKKINYV